MNTGGRVQTLIPELDMFVKGPKTGKDVGLCQEGGRVFLGNQLHARAKEVTKSASKNA